MRWNSEKFSGRTGLDAKAISTTSKAAWNVELAALRASRLEPSERVTVWLHGLLGSCLVSEEPWCGQQAWFFTWTITSLAGSDDCAGNKTAEQEATHCALMTEAIIVNTVNT